MIIRREHNGNFTILPNAVANDQRLSIEAIGVMAYLLSRPPNWTIRHSQLQKACRVGRQKLQRIFRELIQAGYLDRDNDQPRDRHNQFTAYNYVARDVPRKDGVSSSPQVDFVQRDARGLKNGTGNKKEIIITQTNKTPPKSSPRPQAELPLVGDELSEFGRGAQANGMEFVFEYSEPFEAWRLFRGDDGMPLVMAEKIGGRLRRGAWLPSLYPPRRQRAADAS
jgi:hypothetical protein